MRFRKKHTCEGEDVSPALIFRQVPDQAQSLALIVDDPDAPDPAAPKTTWVHWVLFDLPPTRHGLAEATQLPPGAARRPERLEADRLPRPVSARRQAPLRVQAVRARLKMLGSQRPTKAQLEQAMQGHILAKTELIGTYQKGK